MSPRGVAEHALFGAEAPSPAASRVRAAAAFALVAALLAAGLALRRPEALGAPRLYAEDGAVFFRDAFELPAWRSLALPHAGYQNLAVRALAEAASPLPLRWQPGLYHAAALAVAALCLAWFALPGFRHWVPSDALRAGLALLLALVPGQEALMKLSYLQWYLLLWLALTSLMRWPRGAAAGWALAAGCAVVFLTTPFGVVTLPFFALRAAGARGAERAQALAVALSGAAALALNLASPYTSPFPPPEVSPGAAALAEGLAKGLAYRLSAAFLGESRLHAWFASAGFAPAFAVALVLVAALGAGAALAGREARRLAAAVAALAFLSALPIGARGAHVLELSDGSGLGSHGRYFYAASCLSLLLAALLACRLAARLPARARAGLALAALGAAAALHWPDRRLPSYTPVAYDWGQAARAIADLQAQVDARGRPTTLEIPINPRPWRIVLRLEPRLSRGGR